MLMKNEISDYKNTKTGNKVKWGYVDTFFFITFFKITLFGDFESNVCYYPIFLSDWILKYFIWPMGHSE